MRKRATRRVLRRVSTAWEMFLRKSEKNCLIIVNVKKLISLVIILNLIVFIIMPQIYKFTLDVTFLRLAVIPMV